MFDVTDQNGNNVPDPCDEPFTYDADGNLIEDENFTYTWNAENRLVKVEPRIITDGVYRVTNTYDYLGRRVRRMTDIYKVAAGDWTVATDTRYLYDGWNVIVEFDGETGNMSKQYTWGLDLSGGPQGAGGVGGLLACNDLRGTATTDDDAAYIYCYDANGNVRELLDSKDGTLAGLYDYDPYGNLLSSSGAEAAKNRYRFSTKPWDDVAGLYYYGYRYYSPEIGKWIGFDPSGEAGGVNLSAFALNDAVNVFDLLGQDPIGADPYGPVELTNDGAPNGTETASGSGNSQHVGSQGTDVIKKMASGSDEGDAESLVSMTTIEYWAEQLGIGSANLRICRKAEVPLVILPGGIPVFGIINACASASTCHCKGNYETQFSISVTGSIQVKAGKSFVPDEPPQVRGINPNTGKNVGRNKKVFESAWDSVRGRCVDLNKARQVYPGKKSYSGGGSVDSREIPLFGETRNDSGGCSCKNEIDGSLFVKLSAKAGFFFGAGGEAGCEWTIGRGWGRKCHSHWGLTLDGTIGAEVAVEGGIKVKALFFKPGVLSPR